MSLRARLLLGMVAVAAVLTLSAVVITGSTRSHLIDQVDAQLRDAGVQLRQRPGGPGPGGDPTPAVSNLYVGTISRRGVLTTLHLPDLRGDTAPLPQVDAADIARLRAGSAITVSSDRAGSRYRLLTRAEGVRGGLGVVGLALDDVESASTSPRGGRSAGGAVRPGRARPGHLVGDPPWCPTDSRDDHDRWRDRRW